MSGPVGVDREELLAACESRAADGYPDLSLELVEIRALLAELEQAEKERDELRSPSYENALGRWVERTEAAESRLAKVPALVEQVKRLLWDLHNDESTLERSIAETRSAVAAWESE